MHHGRNPLLPTSITRIAIAALFAAGTVGCGGADDGPERYELSGNVLYDGEPVPYGMIVFEDLDTGYKTACSIEDGYYESQSGKGHQGGKFNVTITGTKDQPSGGIPGAPLWQGSYSKEVEIPAESTEMDFEISPDEVQGAGGADIPSDPAEQS